MEKSQWRLGKNLRTEQIAWYPEKFVRPTRRKQLLSLSPQPKRAKLNEQKEKTVIKQIAPNDQSTKVDDVQNC